VPGPGRGSDAGLWSLAFRSLVLPVRRAQYREHHRGPAAAGPGGAGGCRAASARL